MHVLAEAAMCGLDPKAADRWGYTPTAYFYGSGKHTYAIIRDSFQEKEEAWWDLMRSACRQNGIDFETFEPKWRDVYERSRRVRATELSTDEKIDEGESVQSEDESEHFSDAMEDQAG